jgi:hypothetical protein
MAHDDEVQPGSSQADGLRGAIDRFEGDLAVVVFDDGQQLDLPRADLPAEVRPGAAVVAHVGATGTWHGAWQPGGELLLDDRQALDWPGGPDAGEAWPPRGAGVEDPAARRKRVKGLLDDLFGEQG